MGGKGGEEERRGVHVCYDLFDDIEMAVVIGGGGVLSYSLSHSAVSHKLDGCLCPLQAA